MERATTPKATSKARTKATAKAKTRTAAKPRASDPGAGGSAAVESKPTSSAGPLGPAAMAEQEERVRQRAYQRYEQRRGSGGSGSPVEDWLEAERELGLRPAAPGDDGHDGHDGSQPRAGGTSGEPLVDEAWLRRPRLEPASGRSADGTPG